jgi:hypothetical protein
VSDVPVDGPSVQTSFLSSSAGKAASALVEAHSAPAPGATPYAFDSVYAAPVYRQLTVLLGRTWRS